MNTSEKSEVLSTTWQYKSFENLTTEELYSALALRVAVFVVEQACPYPETDFKDQDCLHVLGWQNRNLVAYSRILPSGLSYPEISIGRVATDKSVRGRGMGRALMDFTLQSINNAYGLVPIRISAQSYLRRFYEGYGFKTVSDEYQEDGIPHIEMLRP